MLGLGFIALNHGGYLSKGGHSPVVAHCDEVAATGGTSKQGGGTVTNSWATASNEVSARASSVTVMLAEVNHVWGFWVRVRLTPKAHGFVRYRLHFKRGVFLAH